MAGNKDGRGGDGRDGSGGMTEQEMVAHRLSVCDSYGFWPYRLK